jgi:DNA-binding MarR family transcriptional regulator
MKELNLLFKLSNSIEKLKNKTYMINGDKLYPVEIDVLAIIKNDPDSGVVTISKKLFVTKGAVSQKIKLLCKKGYLEFDCKKGKNHVYKLTNKGFEICKIHDLLSKNTISDLVKIFKLHTDRERDNFNNIVSKLINYFYNVDYQKDIKELERND